MMGLKVTADQIEAVYDKLREKNDRITRYVLDVTKSAWYHQGRYVLDVTKNAWCINITEIPVLKCMCWWN